MKTQLQLAALALLLSTIIQQPSTSRAQGSLTPPGAPAPTMKSLDQIEPRTPISSLPFTITNAGSYYLITNVTVTNVSNGFTIAANGVTLDLNGFTISSTAGNAGGTAIQINGGLRNLTIKNGFVESGVTNNGSGTYSGSGFNFGINYSGAAPVNVLVSRVSVAGVRNHGIFLGNGDSTVVESCTVHTAGASGIVASVVKGSVAADCGSNGIYGEEVADSHGDSSGNGYGILATTANNCYGLSSSGNNYGLAATTANNCYGQSSGSTALYAITANNCYGLSSTGGYGLYAIAANNCYGLNSAGIGLFAYTANSCYGVSSNGAGISSQVAANCNGVSSTSQGILAISASNCYGDSTFNRGVSVEVAISCYGRCISGGSFGVHANVMANSCYGFSASGTGLFAPLGNFCTGSSVSVTTKYNMP